MIYLILFYSLGSIIAIFLVMARRCIEIKAGVEFKTSTLINHAFTAAMCSWLIVPTFIWILCEKD